MCQERGEIYWVNTRLVIRLKFARAVDLYFVPWSVDLVAQQNQYRAANATAVKKAVVWSTLTAVQHTALQLVYLYWSFYVQLMRPWAWHSIVSKPLFEKFSVRLFNFSWIVLIG